MNCRNHQQVQAQILLIEASPRSEQVQKELDLLKAKLKSDQMEIQITALEKANQAVPDHLLLERAVAEMAQGHRGNARFDLAKIDYAHLDQTGKNTYRDLKLALEN